ncbi:10720_t:CDS:2, partial [Dentiscutata erythropus]
YASGLVTGNFGEFTDFDNICQTKFRKVYKCKWKKCDLTVVHKDLDVNSNLQIVQE